MSYCYEIVTKCKIPPKLKVSKHSQQVGAVLERVLYSFPPTPVVLDVLFTHAPKLLYKDKETNGK